MKKIIYLLNVIPLTVFAFPFFGSQTGTSLQNNPAWLNAQSEIAQGQQNIINNSKITQQNINARSQAIGSAVAGMSNNPAENNALRTSSGTTATTVRTTPAGTQIQKVQTTTTPQPPLPATPSGFPVGNNPGNNKNNYQYGF